MNRREALRNLSAGAALGAVAGSMAMMAAPSEAASGNALSTLFWRWQAIRDEPIPETDEEGAVRYARYAALQTQVTETAPQTAREFAMQLFVETDGGASDFRDEVPKASSALRLEGPPDGLHRSRSICGS